MRRRSNGHDKDRQFRRVLPSRAFHVTGCDVDPIVRKRCRVLFDAHPGIVHYRVSRIIEVRTGKVWLCEMRDSEIDPAAYESEDVTEQSDDRRDNQVMTDRPAVLETVCAIATPAPLWNNVRRTESA